MKTYKIKMTVKLEVEVEVPAFEVEDDDKRSPEDVFIEALANEHMTQWYSEYNVDWDYDIDWTTAKTTVEEVS